MRHTLDSRLERARQLRAQGYTCSQWVVMVFDDVHHMSAEVAASVSVGLGGGVGGQHQACGTVTGMAVVRGCADYSAPSDKMRIYTAIKDMTAQFVARNGSMVCAELLADRANRKTCLQYIEDSITILHESLSVEESKGE